MKLLSTVLSKDGNKIRSLGVILTMQPDTGLIQSSQNTIALVAEALTYRIVSGLYTEGDMLPSCREVAQELNISKSTVNKAYKLLEHKGVVKSMPGKGVVVTRNPHTALPKDSVQHGLNAVIWQARAMGLEEENLWKLVGEIIWKFYGANEVKVAYVALDQVGAVGFAREIEEYLNIPVMALSLEEFQANPRRFFESFDILVTSFSYLARVKDAAGTNDGMIVGVHILPTTDDVYRIAAVKKGSKIGVICSNEPNLDPMVNLVKTYNPDVELYACLENDTAKIARIAAQVDLVVDAPTSHQIVLDACPNIPSVTVNFRIEEQSIVFLKNKVLDMKLLKQRSI
jgi:DNA-binding transcriptional regulator YhcF (GntR family)